MEFIWIFGGTGAGKKTLIEKIWAGEDGLRARFGIGQDIVTCGPTIPLRGSQIDPCVDVDRGDVSPNKLAKMEAPHIVIKGQSNSIDRIGELFQLRQDASHRVVFVWLPPSIQLERIHRRDSDKNHWGIGEVVHEYRHQSDLLKQICNTRRVPIEYVNGTESGYPAIKRPRPDYG